MKLIDKDALVAEIERHLEYANNGIEYAQMGIDSGIEHYKVELAAWQHCQNMCKQLLSFLDTLEVKEVGISIPNIDDTLKEEGFDPDSKEAKVFKESYYMALEKLKAQKGEEL